MSNWKELILRENLTEEELQQIPACICEVYIVVLDYFVNKKGYSEAEIFDGMKISIDEFKNPENWLTLTDIKCFNKNIFKKGRTLFTHHDYLKVGIHFISFLNSILILFFKLSSISRTLDNISIHIKKFSNKFDIKSDLINPGEYIVRINDYPFYKKLCTGHECRLSEGILISNFIIHNIKNFYTEHIICGKNIKNLVNNAYGYLNLKYKEDNNFIYINNKKTAKFVQLKYKKYGNKFYFCNEIEEQPFTYNAVQICDDFKFKDRIIFKKNEIYNAPYCLILIKWKKRSFLNKIASFFKSEKFLKESIQGIDTLLEINNSKQFKLFEKTSEKTSETKSEKIITNSSILSAFLKTTSPDDWSYKNYQKYSYNYDIEMFAKDIFDTASMVFKKINKNNFLLPIEYDMIINLIHKYNLSPREMECAIALAKAQTNNEISKNMNISESTVRRHIYNIFNKVGCDNRLQFHHMITNL